MDWKAQQEQDKRLNVQWSLTSLADFASQAAFSRPTTVAFQILIIELFLFFLALSPVQKIKIKIKGVVLDRTVDTAVGIAIDHLVALLIEEANLLRGVHSQVQGIKNELQATQCFLKDADTKADVEYSQGETSKAAGVKLWVKSKGSGSPNRRYH